MELRRGVLAVLLLCACDGPPGRTYFERNIQPILTQKCAGNTSGCHSTNADDPYAFAAGNLDVTSFENISKRRDVLTRFGPYQQPLLLIKAVAEAMPNPMDPNKLQVQYGDKFLPLDVLHAGGAVIDVSSDAYFTLQTWLENGATENGLKPPTPAQTGNGTCSHAVPSGFNAATYTANANYGTFKDKVLPILKSKGCTSTNCHGAPQSDFFITCGDNDTEVAFNFSEAWSFVTTPVDDSQLLRIPLAVAAGGRGHTGGDQFPSTDDGDFKTIRSWADSVGKLAFADTPQKQFFEDNVQPILVQRGCTFMACHSPAATNDFKARSGTQGFFSAIALQKNYDLLRYEFLAVEFPDARRGRAVAKAILTDDFRVPGDMLGIAHRGGPVLETPGSTNGSDPTTCPAWSGNTPPAGVTPFCVIQEWITRERTALGGQVTPMAQNDTIDIVYVDRPSGQAADRLMFDTFQGNADLKRVTATFGGPLGSNLSVTGAPASLLGNCGLGAGPDVQAPDVANDGDRVAFAARSSASGQLGVYIVRISTGTCTAAIPGTGSHNFDPAWSPDGQYLVFSSTRKGGTSKKRSLPQSDLWRVQIGANDMPVGSPEQMTFLSNSEVGPQFMREGRVTMTTEKVGDNFYQLSGRRINWDLTDYHPLLAQRAVSPYLSLTDLTMTAPSIGYASATDVREGSDGNFLLIVSDVGADGKPVIGGGGGALGIFNRSIGPFEEGRFDPGYLPSFRIIDGASATGRAGSPGAYRSPVTMPDGQIMASFTASASALAWQLVAVNPRTGTRTTLLSPAGGRAIVDAVLAYAYPARPLYYNHRQLVFGGGVGTSTDMPDASHAVVHFPDAPMVFTLLTGNLRRGRPVDQFRSASELVVFKADGSELGRAPLADDGSVKIKVPSGTPITFSLVDGGNTIVKLNEEHQLGPSEVISLGIRETITNAAGKTVRLFDAVCGGCHGSVSGKELDVGVSADALTGASASSSQSSDPHSIGP